MGTGVDRNMPKRVNYTILLVEPVFQAKFWPNYDSTRRSVCLFPIKHELIRNSLSE